MYVPCCNAVSVRTRCHAAALGHGSPAWRTCWNGAVRLSTRAPHFRVQRYDCVRLGSRFRAARLSSQTISGGSVAPTQPRHDDIVISRRFGQHASTHAVKQIYAVTYPGHTDRGAEHESYGEAEEVALELAEGQRCSVW